MNRAITRVSIFYTLSIVLGECLQLSQVVLCVLLAPAIISGSSFNFRVIFKFITRLLVFLLLGLLVGEIFISNQFFMLMLSTISLFGLISIVKKPSALITYSTPIFLYCYAIINLTHGITVESSVMVVLQAIFYMVPLGWLCFKLFPSYNEARIPVIETTEENISVAHAIGIVSLISIGLLMFITIDIIDAIFCLSVVINASLRSGLKQGRAVVKSIIPVQISGCIIALAFHWLLLGHQNRVLLFVVLLFTFIFTIYYFSFNTELRHKEIPNFEVSLLNAVLIPLTLYTGSNGFMLEPFIRRCVDMTSVWFILTLLLTCLAYCLAKRHHQVMSLNL